MFQRPFSATGCFTAGSLHPLARSPTLVNTSITFSTMIALSDGAVIHWQPFGASYLPGATVSTWRMLFSVTGAELQMCDVLFPFPWRSCRGSAVFTPSSVGGTCWVRCTLFFFVPTAYGGDSDPQSWPNKRCLLTLALPYWPCLPPKVPNSRKCRVNCYVCLNLRLCRGCSPQVRFFLAFL